MFKCIKVVVMSYRKKVFEDGSNSKSGFSKLVQLTKTIRDGGHTRLVVDIEAVKSVLLEQPEYKNCYVFICSIAGPMRCGKSFLLSLFWHFLQNNGEETINSTQWSSNAKKIKKLFKWSNGPKACTKGIYILKQPIILSLKEKKIALFLADTQGMFDHDASELDQSFLGTFCFLFSSFLIFNVDKRIDTTHLESIHRFATNLRGSDGCFAMQKESLMFVVRDWISIQSNDDSDDDDSDDDDSDDDDSDDDDGHNGNDDEGEANNLDYGYGLDGGRKYFQTVIQNDSPKKAKEHQKMKEYLEYAFGKNTPCCLLPHPGDAVYRKHCSVAKLEKNFRIESFKLFQSIKDECLLKIENKEKQLCTGGKLHEAINEYVSQLGIHLGVTDCVSLFEKDFRTKMRMHVGNAVIEFINFASQKELWEGIHEAIDGIKTLLQELKQNVSKNFEQRAREYYSEKAVTDWKKELDRVLAQIIRNYITSIHVEKIYRNALKEFFEWKQENAEEMLTEETKNLQRTKESTPKKFAAKAREERKKLLEEMKKDIFKLENEARVLKRVFEQCEEHFSKHTNTIIAGIDEYIIEYKKQILSDRNVTFAAIVLIDCGTYCVAGYSGSTACAVLTGFAKAVSIIKEHMTKTDFSDKIQKKHLADESARYQFALQPFKNREMAVKLAFGKLKFTIEIQDQSFEKKASQSSSSSESS